MEYQKVEIDIKNLDKEVSKIGKLEGLVVQMYVPNIPSEHKWIGGKVVKYSTESNRKNPIRSKTITLDPCLSYPKEMGQENIIALSNNKQKIFGSQLLNYEKKYNLCEQTGNIIIYKKI